MLHNLKVKHRIFIEAGFSHIQWGLYDETPHKVVKILNVYLEELVGAGKTKAEVREEMLKVLDTYKQYGGTDPGATHFLDTVLTYVFSE